MLSAEFSIVNCFKSTSHFGFRGALHFEFSRKAWKNKGMKQHFENSDLHEHWIKLVDPKTTMMLQEMEKPLVPLGTPGSKHSRRHQLRKQSKGLHHH